MLREAVASVVSSPLPAYTRSDSFASGAPEKMELVMVRRFVLASILLNAALTASVAEAQLFRGGSSSPAAREPARPGLLGGIREAREERFRREEQAALAAARAAAAQRNPSANSAATRVNPSGLLPNSTPGSAANRRDTNPTPAPALSAGQRNPSEGNANSRSANFRGSTNRAQTGRPDLNGRTPDISGLRTNSVAPASANAFVPMPRGQFEEEYEGPGVTIRLPKDARGVVNYLVDEEQTTVIRPGEKQVFDSKASYVVRYSRGVTPGGKTFGESRYEVTEGSYRFELTSTGWELYREPGSDTNLAPANRLDAFENESINQFDSGELMIPEPSPQAELKRPLALESTGRAPQVEVPPTKDAKQDVPAANEETLPAPKPRSILE